MIRFEFIPEDDEDNFYHTVFLTKKGNDLGLTEVVELFRDFVMAMGYHPESVEKMLEENDGSCSCRGENDREEKE